MVTVPVAGPTRSNVTLAEPDGTVTKINEPGTGAVPRRARRDRRRACWPRRTSADWVVARGSLPPGRARRRRTPAVPQRSPARASTSRSTPAAPPCARRARRGPRPGQAQPGGARRGRRRAARAPSATWSTPPASCARWGAGTVLASLGADGAVLVEDDGVWYGEAPVDRPRSTVGAGDAMLAGFLAAGARGAARAGRGAGLGRGGGQPARQPDAGPATSSATAVRHPRRPTRPADSARADRGRPAHPIGVQDARSPPKEHLQWPTPTHPQVHGTGVKATDPARRRLSGRHGHAQHRRVHRLGPDHRPVHPDRLAAERGRSPSWSAR